MEKFLGYRNRFYDDGGYIHGVITSRLLLFDFSLKNQKNAMFSMTKNLIKAISN